MFHSFKNNDQDRHSVFFLLRLTSYSIRARAAALGEDWGSVTAHSRQMGPRHEFQKGRNKLLSRDTFWKLQ